MKDSSKVASLLAAAAPWGTEESPIWLGSTVSLTRNLQRFHFPKRLENGDRKQLFELAGSELLRNTGLQAPQLLKMEECSARDKELIFERFLSTHPYVHSQPGEGFVLDKSGTFLAVLNHEDHLELTNLSYGEELENSFEKLLKIEIELGKVLNYAFSPTFGFLTSNPTLCGSALTVRAFLLIPAILQMGLLESILEKHQNSFVELTGLTGAANDFVGNVVVVNNTYTLGVSEENILSEVRMLATHLLVEEKGLRTKLQKEASQTIKDRIGRAFGLIKYAYEIDTFEALNALSLLKLGLAANWITGTTANALDELFFNCRRAHLLALLGTDVAQEELGRRRALFLRKGIEGLQLNL